VNQDTERLVKRHAYGFEGTNSLVIKPNVYCSCSRSHVQIMGTAIKEIAVLLGLGEPESSTPCTCTLNLAHALVDRHRAAEKCRPKSLSKRDEKAYLKHLNDLFELGRVSLKSQEFKTYDDVAAAYSGTKAILARKIIADMRENGFVQRIFFNAMVKWGERNSRGRAIVPHQFFALGSELTKAGERLNGPIIVELPARSKQEEFYHVLRNKNGTRMFASGRSPGQRAKDIIKMFTPGWVCLSLDATSFDGSQGWLGVLERHAFLAWLKKMKYPELDDIKRCLSSQNRINIETREMRAMLFGNRASGTGGTSAGNKSVFLCALQWAMGLCYKRNKCHFYCDGDDTLVFVHPSQMKHMRSWFKRLERIGLEVKLENVAHRPSEVVFCRAKIVELESGPLLVKIPSDAFKTQTCIVRHFKGTEFPDYIHTLGVGFGQLWGNVPVHRGIAKLFAGVDGKEKASLLGNSGLEYMLGAQGKRRSPPPKEPSLNDRLAYFETFGISPDAQIRIENLFEEAGAGMAEAVKSFVPCVKGERQPAGASMDRFYDLDDDPKNLIARLAGLSHVVLPGKCAAE